MKRPALSQLVFLGLALHLSGLTRPALAEHAGGKPAGGGAAGQRTVEAPKLRVVDKWDPETEVQAKPIKEMADVFLDRTNAARKKITDDMTIGEAEKKRQLELIGRFETAFLESTEEMRKKDVMITALNFCMGLEWDWSIILGKNTGPGVINKIKNNVSPGGVGMDCVTLAWTRNAATGWPSFLPSIGGGLLGGPKVELAEYGADGNRKYARLEPIKGAVVMLPLGNQSEVLKIKDLTGAYIGAGGDVALEGRNLSSGLSTTRNVSVLVKSDITAWPPKVQPKVGMIVYTKSESAQERGLTPKVQAMYYLGRDIPYQEEIKKRVGAVVDNIPFFGKVDEKEANPPAQAPVPVADLEKLIKEGQGTSK